MNILKTIRDRAIIERILAHRVAQEYPMQRGKISILAAMDFSGKQNNENIFEMVRDRAISSEFLTCRVVQQYSVPRGKISVFATFSGHLGF